MSEILSPSTATNWALIKRMLAMSWFYRWGCIKVLLLQLFLLSFGIFSLGFTGLGIDEIRHFGLDHVAAPGWPLGFRPPEEWGPMKILGCVALLILALALLRTVLNYFYTVEVNRLVQGEIVVSLRAQLYDKMQRLSFRFFDANASSSIINRITGDVQSLRSFVDAVLIQSLIMLLSLGVYLVYMLHIHVGLTLACLAPTPLLWLSSTMFSRLVQPAYVVNRDLLDRLIEKVTENFRGIHVVKAFAGERGEIGEFHAANDAVRDQAQWIFRKVSFFTPLIGLLSQISLVVLLGYGGYLVIHHQMALGTGLVVFAGILQQFSGQVSNIANIANNMQASLTGARRVFEVLDAPVGIQNPAQPRPLGRAKGSVRFDHVWFDHGEDPVLKGIDFEVRPGQSVGIVGPTGSGKSSLVSLIPRFYDPIGGRVLIDGIDLRELDLPELRRNVGLVFQESFLFSTTIAANIAFGHPYATREQIRKAARIAAADEFIELQPMGYETILGEGGLGLSGGQRQRLAIARAMLLEPSILLLDDPTAAVDPGTEHEIAEAMESAMQGRTTFLVSNRLSMLRRTDLIVVLAKGRILQMGPPDELMAQPGFLQELSRTQLTKT